MSDLRLKINIESSKFPDTGIPLPGQMKEPDEVTNNGNPVKMKMGVKGDYKSAVREINGASSSYESTDAIKSVKGNLLECDFAYEEGIPHTYKFLGMDIDDDYRAVIPIGDGYVIVGNMFDSKKIQEVSVYDRRIDHSTMEAANQFIQRMSENTIRRISTAMKAGGIYNILKKSTTGVISPKVTIEFFSDLISSKDGSSSLESFKSILLNLVHESESMKLKTLSRGSEDSGSIEIVVVMKCLDYWRNLVDTYNKTFTVLSGIDIWQHVSKKVLGDDRFNSMLSGAGAIRIVDNSGVAQSRNAIVSGVSRNMSISDNSLVRLGAANGISDLVRAVTGGSGEIESLQDLMLSCIETENMENPFELSAEEVQALSNYDSLQFIDEDAKLCADSYDMNDPNERGMFIRSAIASYEKNFKDYKPKENYDVTEAMADTVENKDVLKTKIVSSDISTDDSEGYIVTSSEDEIRNSFNKKALLKVSKLIGKQLLSIKDMFK